MPVLWEVLPYISPSNLHLVPIGHALWLGVVKDLIKALLFKPSAKKVHAYHLPEHLRMTGNYLSTLL